MNFLQIINQKWKPIHLLLVKNQKFLINLLFAIEILFFLLIPVGFWIRFNVGRYYGLIYELGGKLGTLSFGFYLLTHLPSMLNRFKILPLISASFNIFRRHIGILMFIMAIIHSSFVSMIPKIYAYGVLDPSLLSQREMYGVIGLSILFPLWLTSNDFSMSKLGKYWKILQRLTYLALFFIYLHVAIIELSLAIIGGGYFALVIFSWLVSWTRSKMAPPAPLES